jgi:hypothetical protein
MSEVNRRRSEQAEQSEPARSFGDRLKWGIDVTTGMVWAEVAPVDEFGQEVVESLREDA